MERKMYRVVEVGAGMVGRKMVEILLERNFPVSSLLVCATRSRKETIAGRIFDVVKTTDEIFNGVDPAFFAGTEGEKGAGLEFARKAVEKGAVVIDNGGDFRLCPDVPLVVPEVNACDLAKHKGLIANPNCSTIQMVIAIAPLHIEYRLRRIIAATYQAVSGTGSKAVEELKHQALQYERNEPLSGEVYPKQILFNVIPHIGSVSKEFPGYYTEEVKMVLETRKILNCPDLMVSATCVRVPVFNGHSEALTVQFEKEPDVLRVREILSSARGVKVLDDPESAVYPVPVEVSGKDEVYIGRIRKNPCLENAIDLWVVADNIRKGAALNAVQIAEELVARGLLKRQGIY